MNNLWSLAILLLLASNLCGLDIAGKVISPTGEGIAGVVVAGEKTAVMTNAQGFFRLKRLSPADTLLFYKYGYQRQRIGAAVCPSRVTLRQEAIPIDGISVDAATEEAVRLDVPGKTTIRVNDDAGSLAAVLKSNAQISLKGQSLPGRSNTISLSGHDARHTLVLLDGIPLNMNGKAYDISAIPAEMIAEVEVVPAGSSAYLGAGAIGGAINLITKKTVPNTVLQFTSKTTAGSFGAVGQSFLASRQSPIWGAQASIGLKKAKNDFTYTDPLDAAADEKRRTNNDAENLDALWKLNFPRVLAAEYQGSYRHYEKGVPGYIGQIGLFQDARLKGGVRRHQLRMSTQKQWFGTQISGFCSDEESTYRNGQNDSGDKTSFSRDGAKATIYADVNGWGRVTLGGEYGVQRFACKKPSSPLLSIDKVWLQTVAPFGKMQLRHGFGPFWLSLKTALRRDAISRSDTLQFADAPSWFAQVALEYEGLFRHRIGGSMSRSYSIPSFYDLYWQGGNVAMGNPYLLPETAHSHTLFYQATWGEQQISATWRDDEIDDLIYWYRSISGWKPGNIAACDLSSFNMSITLHPCLWSSIGMNWMRAKSADRSRLPDGSPANTYGLELPYHPSSQTVVWAELHPGKMTLKCTYRRTGSQWPLRWHSWGKMPAYELFDIQGSYRFQVSSEWRILLVAAVNNVLDAEYQSYPLDPAPGRNFTLGCTIEFDKMGG
ncbi:MAG: TonB-dependent receptor [Candidatus Cloacimonetes bacterium]|nr:TonB-dependent receptor [Candidatus Cloacimonadota bacterium]